jgi:CubicO group peptidase (beta-lactamase class C family)
MIYSICVLIVSLSVVFCSDSIDNNISGTIAPGWEFVRELFLENLVQQQDLGAAVAVYHEGYPVVNLKSGWFDESQTKPYDDDTLQLVFSTTKGVVAMAVAICVQRGLLDYSELVTKYWPEYGQNGKENTTVADILSHRAGLPYVSSPISQYTNWTAMIHVLEEEKPLWIPGTNHGYHAVTYGWLAGELVRRVDPKQRSFGQFIKDEIATPIEIEFYIGLPPDIQYRVSPVVPHLDTKNILNETMLNLFDIWNDPKIHQAEIPAAIGMSNAWSIARLYAAFIGNIKDKLGQRLLNEEILKRSIKSNTPANEIDLILQYYSSFSMGFHRFDYVLPDFGPDVFGHHGMKKNIDDQIIKRFYFDEFQELVEVLVLQHHPRIFLLPML